MWNYNYHLDLFWATFCVIRNGINMIFNILKFAYSLNTIVTLINNTVGESVVDLENVFPWTPHLQGVECSKFNCCISVWRVMNTINFLIIQVSDQLVCYDLLPSLSWTATDLFPLEWGCQASVFCTDILRVVSVSVSYLKKKQRNIRIFWFEYRKKIHEVISIISCVNFFDFIK
mgnify:CR=1 FL=1